MQYISEPCCRLLPPTHQGLLQALAVALLSPILFPAYILLVDPLDPEEAPRPKSKPKLPGNLVHIGAAQKRGRWRTLTCAQCNAGAAIPEPL